VGRLREPYAVIVATKAAIAASGGGFPYQWIIVGTDAVLYTSNSNDGTTWTSRTSSFGATDIRAIATNGVNLYVAVGQSGKLATSPDGINWTQQTSSFGTTAIYDVAYGNNVWVAVGDNGTLATSPDGINWTQRTSGVATDIFSISYGDGLWIYTSTLGVMRTATDPTVLWTARTSTLSGISFTYYAPDQAIWVAGADGGTTGAFASSTDGITWTARTSAQSIGSVNLLAPCRYISNATVIAGNFPSTTNQTQTSTNGTTWTANAEGRGKSMASDDTGRFYKISDAGAVRYSDNGTSWTAGDTLTPPASGEFRYICSSFGTPSIR
jgi:hypothetical protein